MWEVNDRGERKKARECTVESCEWNPFYVTKRYDGLHPDLGGHPTDNDVRYAVYASSPFDGRPNPGTPHHCPSRRLRGARSTTHYILCLAYSNFGQQNR